MNNLTKLCFACGNRNLRLILSLGYTPLANSLLTAEQLAQNEPKYPLDLVFCDDCSLVQILESISPETLFRSYPYFSSFSDMMLQHAKDLAETLLHSLQLNKQSLVAEIASNDGYLLQFYKQADIPVLGIEPALNIAKVAEEKRGVPTLVEFFGIELARHLAAQNCKFDLIHCHNVLAHVPDLNGFVSGLPLVLKQHGLIIVEVPYVRDMIDHNEFDTIYHEHLCYFSLTALDRLFTKHGLIIERVERVAIHGGSLRLFIRLNGVTEPGSSVLTLLDEEAQAGVTSFGYYENFAERINILKSDLYNQLTELKRQGYQIAAYGAAAKGSTFLNYFGIGADLVDFVVDRSTYKQGYFMPGVHLPIYSPEKLLDARPDYVLLLSWNFASEIIRQQAEYRRQGGRFILAIPQIKIV